MPTGRTIIALVPAVAVIAGPQWCCCSLEALMPSIALGRRLRTAEVRLTVTSPTFVPARLVGSADERRFGVALERIVLGRSLVACASDWWRDRLPGLSAPAVAGRHRAGIRNASPHPAGTDGQPPWVPRADGVACRRER